jgi:hypothetical protein
VPCWLKSYAGRSLFNGLLSAPATRKRDGVLTILNAFPESRFLLVGDTGEQDLKLYAIVASERPDQMLGIFVRDAGSWEDGIGAVDDPTGAKWMTIMGPSGKECRKDSTGKTVTSDATINARRGFTTGYRVPGSMPMCLNISRSPAADRAQARRVPPPLVPKHRQDAREPRIDRAGCRHGL